MMANVLINEDTLQDIANKARDLSGSEEPMTMDEANTSLGNTKQTLDTTLEEVKDTQNVLLGYLQIENISKYLEYDEERAVQYIDIKKHGQENHQNDGETTYLFNKYLYIDNIDILNFNIKMNDNYIDTYEGIYENDVLHVLAEGQESTSYLCAELFNLTRGGKSVFEKENAESDQTLIQDQYAMQSELYMKPGEVVKGDDDILLGEKFNSIVNEASGELSHAEGYNTHASGKYSHAQGQNTSASGETSHAEGWMCVASGNDGSHAEGSMTKAIGVSSHAENRMTAASGKFSHSEGLFTKASSDNQHVQGKYNIEDTENKYAHIVGNGTTDANRSNAHVLDWEGNSEYAGDVIAKSPCDGTTSDEQVSLVKLGEKVAGMESRLTPVIDNIMADGVIINSSTPDSTKKFKLTVDDSGNITATEVVGEVSE